MRITEELKEIFDWWESDLDIEIYLRKEEKTIVIEFHSLTSYYEGARRYSEERSMEVVDLGLDRVLDYELLIDKEAAMNYVVSYLEDGWVIDWD